MTDQAFVIYILKLKQLNESAFGKCFLNAFTTKRAIMFEGGLADGASALMPKARMR